MSNNEKIMYLRDKNGVPCVTIAFRDEGAAQDYRPGELNSGAQKIAFGYAAQSVGIDKWDRDFGRKKAIGRLNSYGEYFEVILSEKDAASNRGKMHSIASFIVNSNPELFPTRVRQGAKNWLKACKKCAEINE